MDKQRRTPFPTYLRKVMAHLSKLSPEQQDAIQRELHTHMEDAAAEQGQTVDDPATQAAIISQLGSGRRLGRELASAYGLHHAGWYFLLLWVLASIVGSLIIFPMFMLWLPVSGAISASLHTLLLRRYINRANWSWSEMFTYIGSWFLGIALLIAFLDSPYVRLPEAQAEGILFMTYLGAISIVGVMQWLAIRRHIAYAVVWVITPLLGLITSLFGSMAVFWWLEGMTSIWVVALFVGAIVYGACYGAVTGGVMVGLLRLTGLVRQDRSPPQSKSIAK